MSARPASTPPDLPGFRFVNLVGMGGFADVFQYDQLGFNRTVAVKVMLHDLGEAAQKSFEAEANLMAKLSNHPSIVSVFDGGQAADGRPYLVMEYCPPPHLAARLKKSPLSVAKVLEIGIQIASAVEMAHRLGVLHRDIKPANILFTEYGRPALTDFGISVTTDRAQQGLGVGMSVPWAPPEQLTSGQQMGPASDVYSLAATLWTALCGHTPFELPDGPNDPFAMSKRVRTLQLPPLNLAQAPQSLELVLRTAMAKDPMLRYDSALDFARALQNVQVELHHSVTPIDVRNEGAGYLPSEPFDTGTQVVSPASISPDGNSTAQVSLSRGTGGSEPDSGWQHSSSQRSPFISHGRGFQASRGPVEFTEMPLPKADQPVERAIVGVTPVTEAPAARRSGLVIGALIGAVLVGAGAYAGVHLLDATPSAARPTATETATSVKPGDPIGQHVPMPINLELVVEGEHVQVQWENPSPADGDSYLYAVIDPASPVTTEITDQTSVIVPTLPGRTCVQVQLVRANGRYSDPAKACTS